MQHQSNEAATGVTESGSTCISRPSPVTCGDADARRADAGVADPLSVITTAPPVSADAVDGHHEECYASGSANLFSRWPPAKFL